MGFQSPELARLLSLAPGHLPLSQHAVAPVSDACAIQSQDHAILFPGARYPEAALAGLLFRVACWEESHAVAQDIASKEGSYWHGMLHRMEPDSSNAKYWFRQVGSHDIFPQLLLAAKGILNAGAPKSWRLKSTWDPFLFIDWCDEARAMGGQAETTAIAIQMAEWQLLFDWCRS